jgi:protein-S-isoprenylcysteine O-methyltransferase Ste14
VAAPADRPGILAPPPLLTLLSVGAGLAFHYFYRPPIFEPLGLLRIPLSICLLVLAGGVFLAAVSAMHRRGTTPNPYQPSTAVVTGGVYRYSRNPIYVAFLTVVLGIAVAVDSLGLLVAAGILLVVLQVGVVRREERYLSAKFGGAYDDYARRVRRWV